MKANASMAMPLLPMVDRQRCQHLIGPAMFWFKPLPPWRRLKRLYRDTVSGPTVINSMPKLRRSQFMRMALVCKAMVEKMDDRAPLLQFRKK